MRPKHAVVRTDLMWGSDVRAGLMSIRYMGAEGSENEVIDNGHVVKATELLEGEREIYKGVDVEANTSPYDIAVIASVEIMYDERKTSLDDYSNAAGKACRGFRLHNGDTFSVTKDALVGEATPSVGDIVELTAGTKLNVVKTATSGSTVIGKILDVMVAQRFTYYTVLVRMVAAPKQEEEKFDATKYVSILPQEHDLGRFNKHVSELVSADTKIDVDGNVTGTLYYVKDWTEFGNPDKQSGHFIPIRLHPPYDEKPVTVGQKTDTSQDWIMFVENINTSMKFESESKELFTLKFKSAVLEPAPQTSVPSQDTQQFAGLTRTISDLVGEDIHIDEEGAVTGTLHYVDTWTDFSTNEAENKGHFMPVKLDVRYDGKPVTVKRDGALRSTAEDLEWILYVPSKDTKFTFEVDGKLILTLTFTGATFEEASA